MPTPKLSLSLIAALSVVGIAVTITAIAALTSSQNIPLTGTITAVNVGIYSDSSCTQTCTALNVGALNPGDTINQIIYIKNTGTIPETITMAITDWNPSSASSILTLTWDRQNTVIDPGQWIQATLTLEVAQSTDSITNFSCNIIITGTQ